MEEDSPSFSSPTCKHPCFLTDMIPFLQLVADDLYQKLGGNFQDTCIIFPNKRASLFFNQYLWENAEGQTMWTPEYTTISELFTSLSEYTIGDPIYLVVRLWEVYQSKIQPPHTFDQLYSLMEMMLSDFQDIDNNMVDPSRLFLNMADLKENTDFSFLEEEQRKAIEQFFGMFFNTDNGQQTTDTPLKSKFMALWNRLTDIYETYQKALLTTTADEEPMVYEGMMKRKVIEALTSKNEEARRRMDERLAAKTYVMVGFNVLNKTERELFRYLKQHREAKFYWDYDMAYTCPHHSNTLLNSSHSTVLSKYEAGQFILENIKLLGNEFEGRDLFNNMRQPKEITFIQSPTDNAQTRYIDTWLNSHANKQQTTELLRESAVILCNENLLQPVLHSIGKVDAINVTMGYPMTETPIYSLMQALIELQVHGSTASDSWRYKYVAAVLKHPFIQKLLGKAGKEKMHELTTQNVVFPNKERFADNSTMRQIFTSVRGKELTTYLSEILSMVGHCYQETSGNEENTLQIYKECIFVAYTIVNRIHILQEKYAALTLSDETLSRLILQLIGQATVPFHGEPAIGLQVMGLLETRNLDFRHIVMLSVNEGQMPKGDKRTSLIPYTLRAAYGMTTIEREVSLYAYYYYRLFQRAESITLLYNSSNEGGNKGEMSRFMLQTLIEKDDLFTPGQKIDLRTFTTPSETLAAQPISIPKDATVMQQLHDRFNDEHILSPSAINTYMKCPLKFYLNYVAGLRPTNEVADDVDNAMFGTLFHDAMHRLYQPYEKKPFRSDQVRALAQNEDLISQHLNNAFAVNFFHYPPNDSNGIPINYGTDRPLPLNGTGLINRHVIKQFIINQLNADAQMAADLEHQGGYWQIISQEEPYAIIHKLSAKTSRPSTLKLGGIIDRLDLLSSPLGDRIRIVDYKTSSIPHSANTLADLFDPDKCTHNYHMMQALYYCKVLADPTSPYNGTPILPALMYCAKNYGSNYSGIIKLTPPDNPKKAPIDDYKSQYDKDFTNLLAQKIDEIFTPYEADPDLGTFKQCADTQNCAHCDFLTFCLRHPQKTY